MGKGIAWAALGCVVICLLASAGDSLVSAGSSWFGSQAVAPEQPHPRMTDAMDSMIKGTHASDYYSGRFPGVDATLAIGAPVAAVAISRRADPPATVRAANRSPTASITRGVLVLGRDGRAMDRLAVLPGDVLLWRGDAVQDESASAATVSGPLAQVEVAQHLAILDVSAILFDDSAPGTPSSRRRSDVLIVLLLPSTRLSLPRGQAFADLGSEQAVQVTGTLNLRTHMMLRPTSFVAGASPRAQPCTTLSVSGDQDCAGEPVNTP